MKKGINLSLGRKRVDTLLRKVFVGSVAVFCLVFVVAIVLIAYRLILKTTFDGLDLKEQELNSQLLALTDKRDKLLETKSRITEIKKVLSSRAPVTTRMQTISEVVPIGASVNGLSGADDEMEISLESENLSSLNELIEQKITEIAQDQKKGIKKVELRSFGLNPKTSLYLVALGITFE